MTSRKRTLVIVVSALGAWALCQCFTLSLPTTFRIVDARTGRPVANAWVFGLWKSYYMTLAGENPGPRLMGRAARSNADGWVYLPMAFAVHRPMLPLSLYGRDLDHFPQLLFVASGYAPRLEMITEFWPLPAVLLGTPPIGAPANLGGSFALEPAGSPDGSLYAGVESMQNALASTSAVLSQRERCEYAAPAFAALRNIYGASAPGPAQRRDAFALELAACP